MAKPKKAPAKAPAKISERDRVTALCEANLRVFVEEAWPHVVPAEQFGANWHVDAVSEHLMYLFQREFWNLLINIPPRFGKSTISTVMFPAWVWIKDPTMRTVSASYAQSLSTRDSLATRRLIDSAWYRERWGDRFSITTDQNEKMRFENDKRGFRLATSVGGVATGEGADLQVVDDPHNVNEIGSELIRRGVSDWWNVTMPTRTGRAGRSLRVVIMQRVHEEDLAADCIAKGYVHLNLPMEFEAGTTKRGWGGWTDPRAEAAPPYYLDAEGKTPGPKGEGALLWPTRFSQEVIAATLKPPHMSSVAYASQFQQRPAPAEGGLFKVKWWKYYKPLPGVVEDLIRKANDKCWSWDMTFKDKQSSDFVAGTAWVRVGADFYLLPYCVHDRLTFSATKSMVKLAAAKYPGIHYKLVEDKANGTAVVDDLHTTVGGLTPIEPEGGKYARASVMQPYVEAGNVHLPEGVGWVADYVEEFRVFDNGAHDDWIDSSSQAMVWMLKRMVHGFKPFSMSIKLGHSAGPQRGERHYDPRSGEDVVVGYSERGDMRKSTTRPAGQKVV